jgi:WNK lysine deficient protein kinase
MADAPPALTRQASSTSLLLAPASAAAAAAPPAPADAATDRSPQGNFLKFSEMLGKGAFKAVYKGLDVNNGNNVAWNEVNIKSYSKKERERIMYEIKLLRTLKHPNLLAYFGGWMVRESDKIVFVTEIMSSGTLREFCCKYPIPLKQIKRYCRDILECLSYLHSEAPAKADDAGGGGDRKPSLIHRDIKCDNIFITAQGKGIKIGDLGLVTTDGKSTMGTPNFMAPGASCAGARRGARARGVRADAALSLRSLSPTPPFLPRRRNVRDRVQLVR